MEKINQPCIPSKVGETIDDAVAFAEVIGYPVIVRPAFTLGGTGGGIADNEEMLRDITKNGLRLSPITQVLIEKCISGWKEIEFEVIRDRKGNVITGCSPYCCHQYHFGVEGRGWMQLSVCPASDQHGICCH